ncbi:MAG: AAA family ATPase [Candidatus Babeliales bacterium]|jgi:AAA+ superfamily predicted ATPase
MWTHKRLFIVITLVSITNIFYTSAIYSSQRATQQPVQQPQTQQLLDAILKEVTAAKQNCAKSLEKSNASVVLSHNALEASQKSFELSKTAAALATEIITKIKDLPATLDKQTQAAIENLVGVGAKQKEILETIKKESRRPLVDEIKIRQEDWKELRETIGDPKLMLKISAAIVTIALCFFIIKYGTPALINYLTQPRVISETSRPKLFEWFKPKQNVDIDDLIFAAPLQKQLLDLLLRVQTAKKFNEVLPNVLFYGAPGTGKTAFVKALAYSSGLDYALTSGSEFAKITDLNHANNELRKFLNWAKRSKNGLIVFIDEAESLFSNRKLATTSKATQDFINTFLSLVSDQSQKKVMFIFATNHPFKLDDAITNRIGINIEFTLPEAPEREKILSMYLVKTAQENEDAVVGLHPDLIKLLPKYAESLKGFSPRAIKFVAEEMIINARRQESMQLTNDIAIAVIDQAKRSLQQTALWSKDLEKWAGGLNVIHA